MNLTITVDGSDRDTMSADQVMRRIADWQGWRIVRCPDVGTTYDVQNIRSGQEFTYDVANDEIVYPDGKTWSIFNTEHGGNTDGYWSLEEFLDVPFAVWGVDNEDAYWLYHG